MVNLSETRQKNTSTVNHPCNKVRSSHKISRKPVLNEEIEKNLCLILLRLGDVGVGLNKFEIIKVI
jgi:hypothetical protein